MRVTVERTSNYDGQRQHRTIDTDELPPDEADRIAALVHAVDPRAGASTTDPPSSMPRLRLGIPAPPDFDAAVRYAVVVEHEGGRITRGVFAEPHIPPPVRVLLVYLLTR